MYVSFSIVVFISGIVVLTSRNVVAISGTTTINKQTMVNNTTDWNATK
tara:strand:- start:2007 stop:2150 length:144 start_codon:yes stop_codon:yes gene_type:complete